jgi:hypothetical protein
MRLRYSGAGTINAVRKMTEELTSKQKVIVALGLGKKIEDLINSTLAEAPIEQMDKNPLKSFGDLLDNQTYGWQKLGEVTYAFSKENNYNFELT